MSLATTVLLAFLPAIVRPKLEPEKSDRERKLEDERDSLKADLELAVLERDSARRRLDAAWERSDQLAVERDQWRAMHERIPERPLVVEREHRLAMQQYAAMQQLAACQQGLANPLQQAAYQQQMQNAQNTFAHPWGSGELVDCTGGGRSRHLAGMLGAIGGA